MCMENKETSSKIYKIRHSLAHILAQAVLEIRPDAKLGFGPPIDNGFYYDFDLSEPLSPDDLPKLEKRMKHIIKTGQSFEREELSHSEMVKKLSNDKQDYKIEQVEDLIAEGQTLSIYKNGGFWDLCEGPHVNSTREIPKNCFCLDNLAGAYWKGSEKNKMMQRVYGLAFETSEELKKFQDNRILAMERDHRKLNNKHHYFKISEEVGKGLPLWLPNGTVIRDEMEKLAKEKEFIAGYKRVATPHITREKIFQISGHLPYYKDSMFPPMEIDGERIFLKPMNCPHHHMIYKSEQRSYRDLPLRFAEYGTCYRYEQSGELAGLLRVRCMSMNDAHIYCSPEHAKNEFVSVMKMHADYYKLFGLKDFWMRLSLSEKDADKYVDEPKLWQKSEEIVIEAMNEVEIPYESVRGEAAFYGPKIDFQVTNVVGREETASTNQLDLVMGKRFGLTYIGRDNREHTPMIIHRAPLGTHERFSAFLIEHYGGVFPTWLAPIQILLIPVAPIFNEYANKLKDLLIKSFVRTEIDSSNDSFSKKIRSAAISKIPNIIILGEKEMEGQKVTWQRYGSKERQILDVDSFLKLLKKEILERRDWRLTENS